MRRGDSELRVQDSELCSGNLRGRRAICASTGHNGQDGSTWTLR